MKTSNSHIYEYSVFKGILPSMRYDGKSDFSQWQTAARNKLSELLGLPLGECDGEVNIEYEKDFSDYTEYRFTVESEPGYLLPCHLLIPKAEPKPVPLTLCLSGHGGGMHVALGVAKTEADERTLKSWHHRAMALSGSGYRST